MYRIEIWREDDTHVATLHIEQGGYVGLKTLSGSLEIRTGTTAPTPQPKTPTEEGVANLRFLGHFAGFRYAPDGMTPEEVWEAVEPTHNPKDKTPWAWEVLSAMRDKGATFTELGAWAGCSSASVAKYLERPLAEVSNG